MQLVSTFARCECCCLFHDVSVPVAGRATVRHKTGINRLQSSECGLVGQGHLHKSLLQSSINMGSSFLLIKKSPAKLPSPCFFICKWNCYHICVVSSLSAVVSSFRFLFCNNCEACMVWARCLFALVLHLYYYICKYVCALQREDRKSVV